MLEISNSQYHGDTTRISKSGLDLIARSPAHYYARYLDPNRDAQKETKALLQGRAIHTAVLEPYLFAEEYAVMPDINRATNKGKEDFARFMEANAGKTIIDIETYELSQVLREKVFAHPAAAELLKSGMVEKSFVWNDEETGAPCKCRPDFLNSDKIVVDLKTTEDASPAAFGRSSLKYRYHVQAPFYVDGLDANNITPEAFVFIAVEKTPPYAVAVYYVDDATMNIGRLIYRKELSIYQECRMRGHWPAYGDEVSALQLPGYAFK